MRNVVETSTIQDIPTLTILPQPAQGCPVVFVVSGYGRVKEDALRIGHQLAQQGLACISFDALFHGERYHPRLDRAHEPELGGIYPPKTGLDISVTFFEVIQRCLLDVRTLIDHYADDPRLDLTRCGVTGASMGGYVSYLAFANLPQMRVAAPMIGIPCFLKRWTDLLDETSCSNPTWAQALSQVAERTAQHTAFVERIDPWPKLAEAAPSADHELRL